MVALYIQVIEPFFKRCAWLPRPKLHFSLLRMENRRCWGKLILSYIIQSLRSSCFVDILFSGSILHTICV